MILLCLLAQSLLLKLCKVNCCLLLIMFAEGFVLDLIWCQTFAKNIDFIIRGHCDNRTISIGGRCHQDLITVPRHIVYRLIMDIPDHCKRFRLISSIDYDLISSGYCKDHSVWQLKKGYLVWFCPRLFKEEWIELDTGSVRL